MTDVTQRFGNIARWFWPVAKGCLVLLVLGVLLYWFRFSPIAVEAVPTRRGSVIAEVMGTGTLEARVVTTISPKISGRIGHVDADQGEEVEAHKLLAQLDDEELQQQVAIAAANVAAANAAMVRLKADKERAIAVFEQSQRHHARVKALRETNAISLDELERAAESLAVASADTARAEAAISEGQKGLIVAEKTLEYHRARLADTKIVAPFAGLIVARHREAGDVAVPGSAILTLIATDVLWIRAWIDETQLAKLAIDQPVRVVFRSQPDQAYSGIVTRLGKQADRETREFIVDVRVTNLPPNWTIGQRAEVYIQTETHKNVLTIPNHFLTRQGNDEGVFVAEQGVAQWRTLKLGVRGRESIEVLEGLNEAEIVIRAVAGGTALVAGRRVQLP